MLNINPQVYVVERLDAPEVRRTSEYDALMMFVDMLLFQNANDDRLVSYITHNLKQINELWGSKFKYEGVEDGQMIFSNYGVRLIIDGALKRKVLIEKIKKK
jgi:hypothetical protein